MNDPKLLELLECTVCGHSPMCAGESPERAFVCPICQNVYSIRNGILDTIQKCPPVSLRVSTRLLHLQLVINIYERYWRPLLCRLVTKTRFPNEIGIIKQMIRIDARRQVLDIGGGTGLFARALAHELNHGLVVCLDISLAMLEKAQALAQREGLTNMIFIRGDVTRLPFRSAIFDGVNCCGALHLFNDIPGALVQIERVMQIGGRFSCLTFTRGHHPIMRHVLGSGRRLIGMEFFELSLLQDLLKQADFQNYRAETSSVMLIFGVSK